jgi:HD-GYP domain-containing protein (c-di-GMP phosphodiesterase class II)
MIKNGFTLRQIRKGELLPPDLLDQDGRTLLKDVCVIDDPEQIERLIERGVFFFPGAEAESEAQQTCGVASVFRQACDLLGTFESLVTSNAHDHKEIHALVKLIQRLCSLDRDACLANILLYKQVRYSLRHSFHTAVMTELLLKQLDSNDDIRAYAVSGALTMNFSMLELQDNCYHCSDPLTLEQKQAIIAHPQRTAEYLHELGVNHPVWLQVVEHHHETINGSGYPKRLKKDDLTIYSQAVSLADRYCAMITERAYRPGKFPDDAAKLLLSSDEFAIEPKMADTFLKAVGYFPPGCTVRLRNGESALVTRKLSNPSQPLVHSLRSAHGKAYEVPVKRVTSNPSHEIQEAIGSAIVRDLDMESFWPINATEEYGLRKAS